MVLPANPARYILTLSMSGGWPDESLVPQPDDLQRELRAIFEAAISVQVAGSARNPSAHVSRYYELEADSALTPGEIRDMLVTAIERIGADMASGQEIQVALASAKGASLAEGTAKPEPR